MPARSAPLRPARFAPRPARLATRHRALAAQRGLSLIELVMLVMVMSLALTAILQVFIQATRASADPQLQRQALAVAESLMEEVQLMPFTWCDPDDANVDTATSTAGCASIVEVIGPESGEQRSGTPQFDNVNDYNGLTLNGITDISGSAVAGLSVYSANVRVANAALGSVSSSEALQITVTVTGPGGVQATLDGFRTRHAPNAGL